jgi:hypothetical protein
MQIKPCQDALHFFYEDCCKTPNYRRRNHLFYFSQQNSYGFFKIKQACAASKMLTSCVIFVLKIPAERGIDDSAYSIKDAYFYLEKEHSYPS